MSKTRYYYNPKTLRYERVKLSVLNVVLTLFSYLSFGSLFFVGLVVVENYFFESTTEKSLRKENAALEHYGAVLTSQLTESTNILDQLKDQEATLYTELFETGKPDYATPKIHREEILMAGSSDFFEWAESIEKRFEEIHQKAQLTNNHFSLTSRVGKSDLTDLFRTPSIAPVENFKLDQLVSGFGTRINPFHKGLYHHDGIDFSAPAGSNVIASGPGRVIAASNSRMVGGYGNYIEIDHGQGLITRYAHLGELKVRVGQKVSKGQTIAIVGISGGSVAPHVHYEVLHQGKNINPVKFIVGNVNSAEYESLYIISSNQNQSLD